MSGTNIELVASDWPGDNDSASRCGGGACGDALAAQQIAQHTVALGAQLDALQQHMTNNDSGQKLAALNLASVVYGDLLSMSLLWLLGAPFSSLGWYECETHDDVRERGIRLIVQQCESLLPRVSDILGACRADAQIAQNRIVLLDATPARIAQLESVTNVLGAIVSIRRACIARSSSVQGIMAEQSATMQRMFLRYAQLDSLAFLLDAAALSAADESDRTCCVCSRTFDAEHHAPLAPRCCGGKQRICRSCWVRCAHASSDSGRRTTFACPFCKARLPLYGSKPRAATFPL
jgi:hypothetical protein